MSGLDRSSTLKVQQALCEEFRAGFEVAGPSLKLGMSEGALRGERPLHGLRHRGIGDTCGWYLWTGEYSKDPDFFRPVHVTHLLEGDQPEVLRFLGLAPGWRFLLAEDEFDVWFDPQLLICD